MAVYYDTRDTHINEVFGTDKENLIVCLMIYTGILYDNSLSVKSFKKELKYD